MFLKSHLNRIFPILHLFFYNPNNQELLLSDCLACPKVSLLSHNIDQLCLALYSVDKSYYRARILAVEDASCQVFFIDYGKRRST